MAHSFSEIRDLLGQALAVQVPDQSPYVVDIYPDQVIYSLDDRYYQRPYSITDGQVILGDEVEVERQINYIPLQAACRILAAATETGDEDYGFVWRVQINEYGPGKDGRINWTREPLVAAIPKLIEGARVFALNEAQHQAGKNPFGKSVREIVGWLKNVVDTGTALEGNLYILKSAKWLRDGLVDSFERGKPDLFGLSFDATGRAVTKMVAGRKMTEPVEITAVEVDVVYDPTNNGKFIRMAAAVQAGQERDNSMDIEKMKQMELRACRLELQTELVDSKLPGVAQDKLKKQFEGKVFETEDLRSAIKLEKEYLDRLTASGTVSGSGNVRIIVDEHDKAVFMLDDFFAGKAHSFKAAYVQITGDERVTGDVREATRLRAAIQSSTFDQILGDSITRRMVAEYNAAGLDDWKKIASVVPLSDFRTQRRPRMGGYGNLPAVAQAAAYSALTTPADEEATYTPTKRGGTETITLEAIRNDDAGAIRRIPVKLGRAAARTLYVFAFDFIASNPTIYDSVALFHATHANLAASALSKAQLQAGRLQIMKQTEAGSSEVLGIPPRYLLLPPDLEDSGYELTVVPSAGAFTPTSPDAVRRQTYEPITVKTWIDTNNWYLAADPADVPGIEIGFLDGKEEPELFVQDAPNMGSMFSNDQLTYKVRHIYGGCVVDYRGFQGNVVP